MRQFCDTFIETVYKIQVFTSLTVYDLLEKHLMTQEALFLPLDNFHHHQTQRCCVWSKLISWTNIKCQTNCLNVCFKEYILVKQNNDKGIRWSDHVSLKEFDIDQTKHCNIYGQLEFVEMVLLYLNFPCANMVGFVTKFTTHINVQQLTFEE